MTQMELGLKLKRRGIKKVATDNQLWMEHAIAGMLDLACKCIRFSSIDLRGLCNPPSHPNAWGGVFNVAYRKGWIKRTGQYIQNPISSTHARLVPVWEFTDEIRFKEKTKGTQGVLQNQTGVHV